MLGEENRLRSFIMNEARNARKKPDAYFVEWYARIRRQHSSSRFHSFPNGDGGVDLVIFQDSSIVLAQLKFCRASRGHLREFEVPVRAWGDERQFNEWLSKDVTNIDAKRAFREAYDDFRRRKLFLIWEFVSLSPENVDWSGKLNDLSIPHKSEVRVVSIHDLLYYFALEQTGAGYTDSIELEVPTGHMDARHSNNFRTLAFCVKIGEIVKSVRRHGKLDSLLARNVRLEIPGSSVNDDIRDTANNHPEQFFFGNNGIHIITTLASTPGGRLRLEQPAIINGGQTIKQLMSANLRHNKGEVLLRVTEIPKEYQATEKGRHFVGDMIFMSNNNNKMEPWNLRSNDPEQITIAKHLHRNKIFYQRKDFEWKESKARPENSDMAAVIDSKDLATAFFCMRNDLGPAKLKERGIAPLFDRRFNYYNDIFKPLSERLDDALSLARLYIVVGQWTAKPIGIPDDFSGFGRASNNFIFTLIWNALDECGGFRRPFMLIPGKIYRNSCPHLGRMIQKTVRNLFGEFKTDMTIRGVQQNDIFRNEIYWDKARKSILTKNWKKAIQRAAQKDWSV